MASHRVVAALLLATACTPGGDATPLPTAERIVVLSLDTVRADALEDPESRGLPVLARLAAEGARFSRAWEAALEPAPPAVGVLPLAPEERRELRGLGYVE